jgi:hypothetical protein
VKSVAAEPAPMALTERRPVQQEHPSGMTPCGRAHRRAGVRSVARRDDSEYAPWPDGMQRTFDGGLADRPVRAKGQD